jgi:hypothetical protein
VYDAGVFDRALKFDGVDDTATMPAYNLGGSADATFAARVRWDGGADWQRIFDIGNGTDEYMILTPSSASDTVQFAIRPAGGPTTRLVGTAPLPIGEWCHVAVTIAGGAGRLYVNGDEVGAIAIPTSPSGIGQAFSYLGDSQFTADPAFAGSIDDIRVYNRGLSPAEVAALASPPAALAVQLDFPGWVTAFSFPGGQNTATADPDKDGLANVFEFLLGTHPLTANASLPTAQMLSGAQLGLTATPGATYLTIQARVRKQRPGITFTAESGVSLTTLNAANTLQTPPASDGDYEVITFYHAQPLEQIAEKRGFIRLRASLP